MTREIKLPEPALWSQKSGKGYYSEEQVRSLLSAQQERKPTTVYEALLRDGRDKRARLEAAAAQQERKPDDADKIDAGRYRWLRKQHWTDNKLAVVLRPKDNVVLGSFLPCESLLDDTIDLAMKEQP